MTLSTMYLAYLLQKCQNFIRTIVQVINFTKVSNDLPQGGHHKVQKPFSKNNNKIEMCFFVFHIFNF